MKIYMNNDYLQQKYMQKLRWYHFKLGFRQFIVCPALLILFIPVIILTAFIWLNMDSAIATVDMPQLFEQFWSIMCKFFGVFIPALLSIGIISGVGSLVARKDESLIQSMFAVTELRKGNPILIFKGKDKRRGYITREFYTLIPFEEWKKKQDAICDAFNEHIIGELHHGGKHNDNSNRIIIVTAKGRIAKDKGNIYDDDI